MRVWLIEADDGQEALATQLRSLAAGPAPRVELVGVAPPGALLAEAIRAANPDVVLWRRPNAASGPQPGDLARLDLPLLLVGEPPSLAPWLDLAANHAVGFHPHAAAAEELFLALWTLAHGSRRERSWRAQAQRLQQRLGDRVVIDKAKGVLMQRLGIDEHEAYQRLRAQSRRQRKPMREIAQSVLDARALLEGGGAAEAPRPAEEAASETVPFPRRHSGPREGDAERRQQG